MEKPVRKGTVVLPIRENRILLGRKQGSPEIGEGTLNGPGGKMEIIDKNIIACAIREALEELGLILDPAKLEKIAIITFYAAGEPNMEVHFFRTDSFSGEPCKTESMVPEWHDVGKIPYGRMLEADETFLPQLLAGKKFNANVYYHEKAKNFLYTEFFPFVDHE